MEIIREAVTTGKVISSCLPALERDFKIPHATLKNWHNMVLREQLGSLHGMQATALQHPQRTWDAVAGAPLGSSTPEESAADFRPTAEVSIVAFAAAINSSAQVRPPPLVFARLNLRCF